MPTEPTKKDASIVPAASVRTSQTARAPSGKDWIDRTDTMLFLLSLFPVVGTTIRAPYLHIPASQLGVKGDRIQALKDKYKTFKVDRVLGDEFGYYLLFRAGDKENLLLCYNHFKKNPTQNWIYGEEIVFEKVE